VVDIAQELTNGHADDAGGRSRGLRGYALKALENHRLVVVCESTGEPAGAYVWIKLSLHPRTFAFLSRIPGPPTE
jgi:hypothetical protein